MRVGRTSSVITPTVLPVKAKLLLRLAENNCEDVCEGRGGEPRILRRFREVDNNRLLASSYLSVCPFLRLSVFPYAWNSSAPNEWIYMRFDTLVFFENKSRKI